MIESCFFVVEISWSEESYRLNQSKNLQPFFVHVGLISPLIRPVINKKMSFFRRNFFFLRNKIEEKLLMNLANRGRGNKNVYFFIC
jgi:hypothetical protein